MKYICVAVIFLSLASCKKYLDQKPDNLLTEDQLWQTRANAEAYLYNIYSLLHNNEGGDCPNMGASDETSVSIPTTDVRQMVGGNWNPLSTITYNWGTYYGGIRQSFVFEDNIDKVPSSQLSDSLKVQYKAEAVFLRGWFFWKLLRQYGPFVKLTGTVSQTADITKYARAPFDTCVAYINQLMDRAAAHLPVVWTASSNYGRVSKGAALAVKAQVALLAASPLWNGNTYFSSFKNNDGTLLAPASYDGNKWATAAAAARAVIDLGAFKLFTNLDEGSGGSFNPYLSVRDIFLTNWNKEIIMSNNDWSYWGWTKCASPGPGGYNMYNATQNVVDAFCMANGRTIDDPSSGYVETGFAVSDDTSSWGGHLTGEWNMYANREPRFYAYIQYNMHPVLPAVTVDDKNYYSSSANQDGRGRVEFYYSGKSGQLAAGSSNITGYDVLKNVGAADNIRNDATNYRPQVLIRYAEILLDYVEALNESDPANPDIVTYLDMVRTRAGLPGIEAVYPGAVGNKDLMRKYILRERQVELCFENGDRYFTLTRRKMLGDPVNQAIYGMNVNANDNGQGFSFTGFYTRKLFQNRVWDDKMYLYPIYQSDIDKDNAIVQNPGW
ncbi:MAG TPA: RagB/SusD family nutrient uptake outer membrane protein [Puia sp.]|nr:RagB/SusD family nutrient uptake outer membrane protein [Puia sp.]